GGYGQLWINAFHFLEDLAMNQHQSAADVIGLTIAVDAWTLIFDGKFRRQIHRLLRISAAADKMAGIDKCRCLRWIESQVRIDHQHMREIAAHKFAGKNAARLSDVRTDRELERC